jgi:hypothetical protein
LEACGQVAAKLKIAIGLFSAQAMVQMGRVKHQAEFPAVLGEGAEQRHRIRAAG